MRNSDGEPTKPTQPANGGNTEDPPWPPGAYLLHHIELDRIGVKYDGKRKYLAPAPWRPPGYSYEFSVREENPPRDVKYVVNCVHDGPTSITRNGRLVYENSDGILRLYVNGHLLEVLGKVFGFLDSGLTVYYDGETKATLSGWSHSKVGFIVKEGAEEVTYEVEYPHNEEYVWAPLFHISRNQQSLLFQIIPRIWPSKGMGWI